MLRKALSFAKKVGILACVGYTCQEWALTPWYLEENSMEPTLKASQLVLSTPWANSLTRGDIVIVKHPQDPKKRVCKRIIGERLSEHFCACLILAKNKTENSLFQFLIFFHFL